MRIPGMCECEFDQYDDEPDEPSTHYLRTCAHCMFTWYGNHCPHDGHQNPCGNCGQRPETLPE